MDFAKMHQFLHSKFGMSDIKSFDSSIFTHFGAICVKRIRRFNLLTTDLGHALVVCDLTQLSCTPQGQDSLGEQMWNGISHHM